MKMATFAILGRHSRRQRTQKYSSTDHPVPSGITTYIGASHAIAHNKVMIIDNQSTLTGFIQLLKSRRRGKFRNCLDHP
jgi:phosphatidylserine/phosphatidylglycerophosphate/cardiolipin synthase-like enzyme